MKKKYRLKGWVRRTLSILLVVVLTTAVLPDMGSVFVRADGAVVYTQASAPTVDEANKIIYGNGTPLLLKRTSRVERGRTVYYHGIYTYENQIEGTLVKEEADSSALAGWTLVRGYADGSYVGDILIRIADGSSEISNIYGTDGQDIIGNITIEIENNSMYDTQIYGSYNKAFVRGNITISSTGGRNNVSSPCAYITVATGNVDGNIKLDFVNANADRVNITGNDECSFTGNVDISMADSYACYLNMGIFTARNVGCTFQNSYVQYINRYSGRIYADSVNITAEGLIALEASFIRDGNISGDVMMNLTSCTFGLFTGVAGYVGNYVDVSISQTRFVTNENTNEFSVAPAEVGGNVNVLLDNIEASKCGLNIGDGNVHGVVTTKITGTNAFSFINCGMNATQSILYLSGSLSITDVIKMNGFTDKRVHIQNFTTENPIVLQYSEEDCTDGRIVAVDESGSAVSVSDFTVTDMNNQVYNLLSMGNEAVIALKSNNTITATATGNGSISPSGAVSYTKGASAVYTITPAQGYAIADVLVDGRSIGVTERYTFDNIFADHTIEARFEEISVNGMELIHEPSRLEYQEGDTMDFTGMKVKLSYTDGTSYECPYEEFEQYGITTDYDGQPLTESMNLTQFKITYGTYLAYTEPISVTARTQNIGITMSPFDFGEQEAGYISNGGSGDEYIEISNTGNDTVEIDITMPDGMDYFVIEKDKLTLAPGAGGKIYVRPKQGLPAGTYTGTLKVGTPSGTLKETTLQFTVKPDVTLPTGSINVSGDKWSGVLNQITFGKFFNKTQKVSLSAADSGCGVGSIHYMIADRSYTIDELSALSNGKWTLYEKEFNIEPDRQYIIYAKITDKAGNAIYVSSEGMILDATLPKIGGVEQNGQYYDISENFNKKFTVQDENLDYVTINGKRVFPENGEYTLYPKDDIQEITAVDKAGNVSVVQVTVAIRQPSVPPVITGIADGGVYCESVSFTVEDDNLDKVFAGDIELIPEDGVYTVNGNGQPVKITAQDVDDNRTEMMIQVNPQHTWKTGGVEKAPACTETGSANAVCEVCGEHGQTELLPLGHDFSQDWTIDVEPTGKTAGEKSHHCSRCDGRRDVMKIPATGVGTVKVTFVTGEGVPEMSVANSQESLIKNVLTQKETDMLAQGYDIYLTVTVSPKEDVSELQQEQIAGWILKRPENGGIVGYYDISMTKQTGDDGEKIPVTQTVAKLILKAGRPDESGMADGTTREYQMLIFNGGDIQELVTVREDDGKIRFATDQTGTIVLVYHDTAVTPDNPSDKPGNTPPHNPTDTPGNPPSDDSSDNPGNDHGDSDSGNSKNKGTTPVQTGDSTPVTWLFALLALSGTGIVGSKAKKKSKVTE